jgi:hypothetical protein
VGGIDLVMESIGKGRQGFNAVHELPSHIGNLLNIPCPTEGTVRTDSSGLQFRETVVGSQGVPKGHHRSAHCFS